ncbi:oxygen-independent coproporphyrinogen III oxidase [Tahibacter soli]|uniref:Coproporphyrinogen-III oxidase n=1 Tax=Tahibacter soli TaxID=2983605 RepID=A0A9X4BHN6_9GAMM|nr:oxygen-independent coproporphyrinogen III oxidase [Tahibacter soli]MDC8012613.1 oxygen-independent coproporphyrinogen III oxidase [Tahibacter soli]
MKTYTPPVFDAALVGRYDLNGPRYTSYPTAPLFRPDFGPEQFAEHARRSNEGPSPRGLSVYVHVPFCASPCFYCGCTRVITRDRAKAQSYLDALVAEIDLVAPLFDRRRAVSQLHLGGGTPNFFDLDQMAVLMAALRRRFTLDDGDGREFGIEIDPRCATGDYVRGLAALGFNRLSVGIQDFDHDVQVAINRVQGVEETAAIIGAARDAGFRSVSVDLIYGLPRQTIDGFARTLHHVVTLAPDRVAAYSYAHLPETFKAQRQIRQSELPDARTKLALLGLAVQRLGAAGYGYIGMDHFALPRDELARAHRDGTLQRNFQGYSTRGGCDLVGLGASAISRVGDSYSQNAKELPLYYAALEHGRLPVRRGLALRFDDRLRRDVIERLMCRDVVDFATISRLYDIDFATYFAPELERLKTLERDGLVSVGRTRIAVTPRGRFLLRVVAMAFDAYVKRPGESAPRYSRAI